MSMGGGPEERETLSCSGLVLSSCDQEAGKAEARPMTATSFEHRSRRGWLGRPVTWRLQATTVSMTTEDGAGQTFDLRDIREVRIYVTPSRYSEHYVCELRLADNTLLRIEDGYARFVVWTVSSRETYRSFVTALCAALASVEPHCRFRAGPRMSRYLLTVLAMAVAIYLLAQFMISQVGMSETDGQWLFAFGCGLILLKSPYWRSANRQTEFDPANIPEGLLPREGAGAIVSEMS